MNELPTLYRLADGTQGDPSECSPNDKGVLTHSNGVPVVIDSDGKPVEIKREAEVNKTKQAADAGKDAETRPEVVAPPVAGRADQPSPARPVDPAVAPRVQPAPVVDAKRAEVKNETR